MTSAICYPTACPECRCGAEGARRRDAALALFADYRESLVRRGQRALLGVLLKTGAATMDDVRDQVDLPAGISPKVFGAVPLPLARAGIIFADGYAKTRRPLAHARPLTLWGLADSSAAVRWLDTHPDLSAPVTAADQGDGRRGLLFPF